MEKDVFTLPYITAKNFQYYKIPKYLLLPVVVGQVWFLTREKC